MPCPVDLRKKLGVKIEHIIGQDHEPLQLGRTEVVDPSAQLMEMVRNCIILSYLYVGNNLAGDWWQASIMSLACFSIACVFS